MLNAVVGDNSKVENSSVGDNPAIDGDNITPDIPAAAQWSSDDNDDDSQLQPQRARGGGRNHQRGNSVDVDPGAYRHGKHDHSHLVRSRGSKSHFLMLFQNKKLAYSLFRSIVSS